MFENVIGEIDEQLAKLQRVRALLTGVGSAAQARRGRPAGATKTVATSSPKKRRKLSVAGRRAIAEAQKKRWAAIKAAKKAK